MDTAIYEIKYLRILPILLLSAGGCTMHSINMNPEPSVSMSEAYISSDIQREQTEHQPQVWWKSFEREALNDIIDEALPLNFNIKEAAAVWAQATAQARQTYTTKLPEINIEGRASTDSEDRNLRSIGSRLSWDIDITGRIAAATYADDEEARANAYLIDAVKLAISADIAEAYFNAVAARARIRLLRDQIQLSEKFLRLLRLRFDNGVGNSLDILRKESQVAENLSLIPPAEADLQVFENRIDVLTGTSPDRISRVPSDDTLALKSILPPVSVPAALLLNRPDLRALKAELIAADADIAVAIADRFPRVMISGAYSKQAGFGFEPVSIITASFVQPLLDWGRRKAETVRAKALYEERLAAYTQRFIEAVEDVENALIREKKQKEFLIRLDARKKLLQRIVSDSEERYKQGIDDYLAVITALQELRLVERNMITERLYLFMNRIALFRAIGGSVNTDSKTLHINDSHNDQEHENE